MSNLTPGNWPKNPPKLTSEQQEAREKFMMLWHRVLPERYGLIEKFNHGFAANLALKENSKTLEVGAGLGAHAGYEDLSKQEYHCLEYREEFCRELKKILPADQVWLGDIQERQPWTDESFDRVIAIHVLEHLPNLPLALAEISRILKSDGVFDIVSPCEGGLANGLARKLSAERLFRKNFKMDYTPIRMNEHVNDYYEIVELLASMFEIQTSRFFPISVPIPSLNFCAGFRLIKKIE